MSTLTCSSYLNSVPTIITKTWSGTSFISKIIIFILLCSLLWIPVESCSSIFELLLALQWLLLFFKFDAIKINVTTIIILNYVWGFINMFCRKLFYESFLILLLRYCLLALFEHHYYTQLSYPILDPVLPMRTHPSTWRFSSNPHHYPTNENASQYMRVRRSKKINMSYASNTDLHKMQSQWYLFIFVYLPSNTTPATVFHILGT